MSDVAWYNQDMPELGDIWLGQVPINPLDTEEGEQGCP